MKKMIKYSSIEQFRNVVKDVTHSAQYTGTDVDGNIAMNRNAKMPTLTIVASEKIHGTNAAVCYNEIDGFWVQSRSNIITVDSDNAECATYIHGRGTPGKKDYIAPRKPEWMNIINALANEYNIDLKTNTIAVFYEWCGGNIQTNSAVSGLDKQAIIFQHFRVTPFATEEQVQIIDLEQGQTFEVEREPEHYWLETCETIRPGNASYVNWISVPEFGIHNIMNFPTYEIEIDFNNAQMSQNKLIELVDKIEANSPVGQALGKDGNIGEGVVCTFMYKDKLYKFKVKGEKHSKSKVKTLSPVDEAKEQAKIDFANYACPAWRLEQMYQETFDTLNGGKGDVKKTGDFLRAVIGDVMKEEADVMKDRGLEPKEVNGKISQVARQWFMEQLDKEAGL